MVKLALRDATDAQVLVQRGLWGQDLKDARAKGDKDKVALCLIEMCGLTTELERRAAERGVK